MRSKCSPGSGRGSGWCDSPPASSSSRSGTRSSWPRSCRPSTRSVTDDSSPASVRDGTRKSSVTSAPPTGSTCAAPTWTRRSTSGVISGPARPSRSGAASTTSRTSSSRHFRRRAPRSRSSSVGVRSRRSVGRRPRAIGTTPARRARRVTPSGCRSSRRLPRQPDDRCPV